MQDTVDFHAVGDGAVENQVVVEAVHMPGAQTGAALEMPLTSHVRMPGQFGEGTLGSVQKTFGGAETILGDVAAVGDQVTHCGRFLQHAAHAAALRSLGQRI